MRNPGSDVYIVERDECGAVFEVSGYMFLAQVGHAVIVSAFINDYETVEETLEYHIEETATNYTTDLAVFPADDCYDDREDALAALRDEAIDE